jgi:uncharacterized protein (TIRG00374 family)
MRFNYFALVGLALFAYIIARVGAGQIASALLDFNPVYAIPLLLVVGLNVLIKSIKWKIVITSYGFNYSLRNVCKAFLAGMFAGLITPGRVGDFIRAFYLKEKDASLGGSLSTVVVDRVLDIIALVIFSLFALAWLSTSFGVPVSFTAILGLFLLILSVYLVTYRKMIEKVLRPIFHMFVPEKYKTIIKMDFEDFYSTMHAASTRGIAVAFFLGVISWLLTGLEGYVIGLSLGINAPYHYFLFFLSLLTLVELLPISISGIGTREAAAILLFSFIGFSADKAVAFSLIYLVLGYWVISLIGAGIWFKAPPQIKI